jgi:hypothetical protein
MDPFARFLEAQTRALEQIANKREVSVQGMSLPQFHGKENESVEMFIWQARQFFEAKNFDLADAHVQARCVTTIIANFRGNASFWYRSSETAYGKPPSIDVQQDRMEAYFTSTNLQNSLRGRLHTIHQSQFDNLFAYTAAFRGIIHQATHMTEHDQVGYYVRGLHASTISMVKFTAPRRRSTKLFKSRPTTQRPRLRPRRSHSVPTDVKSPSRAPSLTALSNSRAPTDTYSPTGSHLTTDAARLATKRVPPTTRRAPAPATRRRRALVDLGSASTGQAATRVSMARPTASTPPQARPPRPLHARRPDSTRWRTSTISVTTATRGTIARSRARSPSDSPATHPSTSNGR